MGFVIWAMTRTRHSFRGFGSTCARGGGFARHVPENICTWLREIFSFSCLTVLPGPAWVLLSKTNIPLFPPLYCFAAPSDNRHVPSTVSPCCFPGRYFAPQNVPGLTCILSCHKRCLFDLPPSLLSCRTPVCREGRTLGLLACLSSRLSR